jgi:hypothetical protein
MPPLVLVLAGLPRETSLGTLSIRILTLMACPGLPARANAHEAEVECRRVAIVVVVAMALPEVVVLGRTEPGRQEAGMALQVVEAMDQLQLAEDMDHRHGATVVP